MKNKKLIMIACTVFISCNKEEKIMQLLKSNKTEEVVRGAYMAGESKNKRLIPLLLQDAADIRTSTAIKFKGYNVYQEKMIALKKIFNQEPPSRIIDKPDSVIIKFYTDLYENTK